MRVAIPHDLGREEVRRRMRERIGELAGHMPGQVAQVQHSWKNDDRMDLNIGVMGQDVRGHIDIEDSQVWVDVTLPAMLSFFEPAISDTIKRQGHKMLDAPAGDSAAGHSGAND